METCLVHFTRLEYQIIKPDEETAKQNRPKTQHNFTHEHMAKVQKKQKNANLANQIQHYAQRIIHHNLTGFIAESKDDFILGNLLNMDVR